MPFGYGRFCLGLFCFFRAAAYHADSDYDNNTVNRCAGQGVHQLAECQIFRIKLGNQGGLQGEDRHHAAHRDIEQKQDDFWWKQQFYKCLFDVLQSEIPFRLFYALRDIGQAWCRT